MERSILDNLGEEVTGIVTPVTLCMATTVLLVRILNPDGASNSNTMRLATAYYNEKESDSATTKFEGALINALIVVAAVTGMTFMLFLLYKYRCTRCIYGYMAFAGFSIFFTLTGLITLQLVVKFGLVLDAVSFTFMLFNFAVVGVTALFFWPAPLALKQGYLVVVGTVTAYVFTFVPEWTTWALLVAMALYDLWAVLSPGGPLKVLVELAMEREEDIPALIYEARPAGRAPRERRAVRGAGASAAAVAVPAVDASSVAAISAAAVTPVAPLGVAAAGGMPASSEAAAGGPHDAGQRELQPPPAHARDWRAGDEAGEAGEDAEQPLLPAQGSAGHSTTAAASGGAEGVRQPHADPGEGSESGLPDGIKLGMGDFIFYSVLVGRAAMYDMLTAFAAYLGIVAGLGATLLLLALARKALPALPVSIALGASFYFLARGVLEPFVLPLSVHLLYF
ncbi:hypothetical protein WJX81_008443 [Elliptochloris bilobata]|uniref:Presenilin n=1 Tax=Elliptochloris bilobata TaxID=381761 RepID=A0AAW1S4S2_9CHLO